jgi:sugar phosphate isomerase/epimerase
MKPPIAIQLYSLRRFVADDFTGTLRRIKEIGYDAVEFAGDFGGRTPEQLKRELNGIGLLPLSAHVGFDSLTNNLDETVRFYKSLGTPFVICAGTDVSSTAAVTAARGVLLNAARHFAGEGIRFGYHNHWAEFEKRDGRTILDTLLAPEPGPVVHAQLDYCWIAYKGADPVEITKQWGAFTAPPHFKDINADYKTREPHEINAEAGNGIIDFESVLSVLRDAGTLKHGIIAEQEAFDKDPFDAVSISIRNIRNLLEKTCRSAAT